jgi:hypothetical protein
MRIQRLCLLAALLAALEARAAAPPAQKLLPKDTVFVLTIPDCASGLKTLTNSAMGNLWRDPAIKAFKDKFNEHLKTAMVGPLEQQLGIHVADYQGLLQGQLTFAMLPVEHPDDPGEHFASVFILDTADHAAQLGANLAALKKKWIDAGKTLKTGKIRDTDFNTFITSTDELSRQKLAPALLETNGIEDLLPKPTNQTVELLVGQSGPLLLVSQSREALEKILARQAGGLIPALDESPAFQNDFAARLRGAPIFAWINAKTLVDSFTPPPGPPAGGSVLAGAVAADGAMATLGFTGLTSASISYHATTEGMDLLLFVGAPESSRRGLLKILATEAKDSSPPPFIPADAVKFSRMRFDMPANWKIFETTLNRLNPDYAQLLNYVFNLAGKDKDEKYDLRAELLDNLGDDLISYERSPVNNTVGDLKNPPGLFLIGSPNPEKLASALRVALGVVVAGDAIKDREFLGRKIYSATMPVSPQGGSHGYHFAASGGYVAISGQVEMLEEYLRSSERKTPGLDQTPGLRDAAQKGGGMSTGIFSFSNDKENMRALVETLRKEQVSFSDLLLLLGVPLSATKISTVEEVSQFKEWMDFSLLPPVDQVTRYFNYSVWVGGFTPEGFSLDCITPALPPLR